jgi:PAS domain S-box-containing protein
MILNRRVFTERRAKSERRGAASMSRRFLTGSRRYGITVTGLLAASLVRLALHPILGPYSPFTLYYVVVLVSAWYCGSGPSIVALVLGSLLGLFLFSPPSGHQPWGLTSTMVGLGLFFLVGLAAIGIIESHRQIRESLEEEASERRRAERELRESEAWHRVTLSSIGDAVVSIDADGRVQLLNKVAEEYTGWMLTNARGLMVSDVLHVVHVHSGEKIETSLERVLGDGATSEQFFQVKLISRQGRERIVDERFATVHDENGTVAGAVFVFRDATRRRVAERALREHAALLELAHVLIRDTNDHVVAWSAGAEQLYGWSRNEATGRSVDRLLKTRYPAPKERVFSELRDRGQWQGELVQVRRDGTPIIVASHWVVQSDEKGDPVAILEVNNDITERKVAREALKVSEERYRLLTELIPQLVWTSTPEGQVDYASPRWLDYTGYHQEQAQGDGWLKSVHPDDRELAVGSWKVSVANGAPHQCEYRIRGEDGIYRWFLSRALPLRDEQRRIVKWYGTSTDIDQQKRVRDALKVEKERLALALEAGRMGSWEWDLRGDRVDWSENVERFFGLEPGAFDGTLEHLARLVHPDDRDEVLGRVRESIVHRSDIEIEYRSLLPDGSVRWMAGRGRVFHDETGQPARAMGICMDISERKRSEERVTGLQAALRHRIGELETLLDLLPVGVVIAHDPLCRSVRANRSLLNILGEETGVAAVTEWPSEAGKWRICREGRELPTEELPLRRSASQGIEIRDEEYEAVFKDGRVIHFLVSANPLRDPHGEPKGCVGVLVDISERRRNENISRFLADVSNELAALTDPETTLEKIARQAVPFFADFCVVDLLGDGQQVRQVAACHADPTQQHMLDLLGKPHPLDRQPRSFVDRVLKSGRAELVPELTDAGVSLLADSPHQESVLRALHPHSLIGAPLIVRNRSFGAIAFVLTSSRRSYDPADLALAEDLARRAAIAVDNARLYQELRNADRHKNEFLAMLAHELRNPLVPITNAVYLLAHPAGVSRHDQLTIVEMLERQTGIVTRLVEDLMDVTRISQGKIELREELVDLVQIVERAVSSVRPLIVDRQQRLELRLPATQVQLYVDPVRLEQVLWNVLNNASKYTDPGGSITLSTAIQGDEVIVRVEDTGVGIEPFMLTKIFDLFTQIEERRDRAQGGLGIGLNLVRNLVELHGGSITAHSKGKDQGSEFVISLPATSAARQKTSPTPPQPEPSESIASRRILIVDDNVDAARSLCRLLTLLYGQQVEIAHDGPTALAMGEKFVPEIVILDIGLPGMSGYEVASSLRKTSWGANCLLIAMTGYGQAKDRERSLEAGFDLHLVKPVKPITIRSLLESEVLAAR